MQNTSLRVDCLPKDMSASGVSCGDYYLIHTLSPMDESIRANIEIVMNKIADPLTQQCYCGRAPTLPAGIATVVEVGWRPGVTDNTAHALQEALTMKGIKCQVQSGQCYLLTQTMNEREAHAWATPEHANPLVNQVAVCTAAQFSARHSWQAWPWRTVELKAQHGQAVEHFSPLLSSIEREQMSKQRGLGLSSAELDTIWEYYRTPERQRLRRLSGLPVGPTDVEIELLAQSWSEHCKHKIFQAKIEYQGPEGKSSIDGLFKTFIKAPTARIVEERQLPWAISLFKDNAGIVRFDERLDVCLKVETHNSPSALDPYGGAITGILGVNRDILGTGIGARPVANLDVFCLPGAEWQAHMDAYPLRVVEPVSMLSGVHRGVQDGGNKSGIPTVNGSFFFDSSFAAKPLVFVGTLGVLPQEINGRPSAQKQARPGDLVVIVGGAVGADGIHGATFSSMALDESSPLSAVQIGDPLTQKRALDFVLQARDAGLYTSITDNGAGGISSSVGEMATQSGGVTLHLERNLFKYPHLAAWEILVSESQERMTLAVDPSQLSALRHLARQHGVDVYEIGTFNDTGMVTIYLRGDCVAQLPLHFIHDGNPGMSLKAQWNYARAAEVFCPHMPAPAKAAKQWHELMNANDWADTFKRVLHSSNVASKRAWVERYDSEVQAATATRPFEGSDQSGPSDAALLDLGKHGGTAGNGVALAHGMATRLMNIDPKLSAQWALDEALRSLVCAGADPECVAILDNFCWPDPIGPGNDIKLGALVRACQGLALAARDFGTPLISGKDSMKNDYKGPDRQGVSRHYWVHPTLLITALGRAPMNARTTMAFKRAGDDIVVLFADNTPVLQASELAAQFDLKLMPEIIQAPCLSRRADFATLHQLMRQGLIRSAHDVSEGGLWSAIAESAFASNLGVALELSWNWQDMEARGQYLTGKIFGEWSGAIVLSLDPAHTAAVQKAFAPERCRRLGKVTEIQDWHMRLKDGSESVIKMHELKSAWLRQQWP